MFQGKNPELAHQGSTGHLETDRQLTLLLWVLISCWSIQVVIIWLLNDWWNTRVEIERDNRTRHWEHLKMFCLRQQDNEKRMYFRIIIDQCLNPPMCDSGHHNWTPWNLFLFLKKCHNVYFTELLTLKWKNIWSDLIHLRILLMLTSYQFNYVHYKLKILVLICLLYIWICITATYICICIIYMVIYLHIYAYTYISIHTYLHIYVFVCICVYICV